ncbi:MAG: AAA family ATPase [Chloroflexota bacterium]
MYKDYFHLKELPFSIAPDPRYLFMSDRHREALAHLVYGIAVEGGFVMLTGEVGTGKTTVCRCLLEQIPKDTDIAFILNPKLTVEELLATVCDELGIPYPPGTKSIKVFTDRINAYLLDAHAKGRKTVLIIEEAQNLTVDVLEQIRLLTNLETSERKLLQVVMVGQPELRVLLDRPELRQLAQRITARYHLDPLSRAELAAYVSHRLTIAGARGALFPPVTLRTLFRLTGGVPRLINLVCDRALLGVYAEGKDRVSVRILRKAAGEVFGKTEAAWLAEKLVKWALPCLLLAGLFAGGLAAYYYHQRPPLAAAPALKAAAAKGAGTAVPIEWPAGIPAEQSRDLSFRTLFGLWGIIFDGGGEGACSQARRQGIWCLEGNGYVEDLIDLNRPAVIRLVDGQGRDFYGTLVSLSGQNLSLVIGKEDRTIRLSDMGEQWTGDYTVLWRVPPHYRGPIRPLYNGKAVSWLDKQLSVLRGRRAREASHTLYDDMLVREVKEFQAVRGIQPDGVVGPTTIIHLQSLAGSKDPQLLETGR